MKVSWMFSHSFVPSSSYYKDLIWDSQSCDLELLRRGAEERRLVKDFSLPGACAKLSSHAMANQEAKTAAHEEKGVGCV